MLSNPPRKYPSVIVLLLLQVLTEGDVADCEDKERNCDQKKHDVRHLFGSFGAVFDQACQRIDRKRLGEDRIWSQTLHTLRWRSHGGEHDDPWLGPCLATEPSQNIPAGLIWQIDIEEQDISRAGRQQLARIRAQPYGVHGMPQAR